MKKTLLVTAMLISLLPTAQAAINVYEDETHQIDLYGRAYGAYIFQDANNTASDGRSDSYFRTGLKTNSMISDSFSALAHIEMQFESRDNNDAASASKTRLIYAGLQGDWGKVTFGRNYVVDEMIADWTDAGTTNYSGNVSLGSLNRQTNLLKFETSVLDETLSLAAHYQPESSVDASDGSDSQSSYSFGGVYGFDFGLELGATYTGVATDNYTANTDNDRSTILAAARYKYKGLTASVVGDVSDNDEPTKDWTAYELAIAYTYSKVTGTAGYKVRDTDGMSENSVDEAAFGVAYKYNQNFQVVSEYVVKEVGTDENQWHMAARYDF